MGGLLSRTRPPRAASRPRAPAAARAPPPAAAATGARLAELHAEALRLGRARCVRLDALVRLGLRDDGACLRSCRDGNGGGRTEQRGRSSGGGTRKQQQQQQGRPGRRAARRVVGATGSAQTSPAGSAPACAGARPQWHAGRWGLRTAHWRVEGAAGVAAVSRAAQPPSGWWGAGTGWCPAALKRAGAQATAGLAALRSPAPHLMT